MIMKMQYLTILNLLIAVHNIGYFVNSTRNMMFSHLSMTPNDRESNGSNDSSNSNDSSGANGPGGVSGSNLPLAMEYNLSDGYACLLNLKSRNAIFPNRCKCNFNRLEKLSTTCTQLQYFEHEGKKFSCNNLPCEICCSLSFPQNKTNPEINCKKRCGLYSDILEANEDGSRGLFPLIESLINTATAPKSIIEKKEEKIEPENQGVITKPITKKEKIGKTEKETQAPQTVQNSNRNLKSESDLANEGLSAPPDRKEADRQKLSESNAKTAKRYAHGLENPTAAAVPSPFDEGF